MTEDNTQTATLDEKRDLGLHPFQKVAMVGMMVLVLLSFSLANLQSIIWISSDWLVSTILPAIVTEATNQARATQSLEPLRRSELLDQVAQMKANDMAQNGYFAHWSPTGVSPWYWFEQAGYKYVHAGENLAVHFTDSAAVVDAWLKSPTHRANIMNGNYREIGIGTAKGRYEGYDTVFVVQMFGTPAAAAPVAAAVSSTEQDITEDKSLEIDDQIGAEEGETTVSVTNEGTVVYESYAATENQGEVLSEVSEGTDKTKTPFIGRVATSPQLFLQIAYSLIGLVVIVLLLSAMFIEWRRRHPVQMAYSAGLLMVMTLLFVLHGIVSGGVMIA